jgi:hypothetical protein
MKEVTTTWSRHWSNHEIKSSCLLCIYFIAIVVFQEFSYFTCIIVCEFNTESSLVGFGGLDDNLTVGYAINDGTSAKPMVIKSHRTVRCAPRLSGVPSGRRVATVGSNNRLTWQAPDSEQCTVRWRTRLSSAPVDRKLLLYVQQLQVWGRL